MYRVALNVAISFYRVTRKNKGSVSYTDTYADIEDVPEGKVDERSKMLQAEISKLKELDKALIILYLDDRSYREISDITGITETNVATKVSRIKERLKKILNK